ncbi:MAG: hypothetical protein SNJ70_10035 [Armatimonadota bacterium]
MRAGYGEKIREYFADLNPLLLVDLGPGVFESATVDTNIILLQKQKNQNCTTAVTLKNISNGSVDINSYVKSNGVKLCNLSKDSWFIGSDAEQRLKEKIERIGKPLKDWDVNIYRGVLTGLNEAFIIDTDTKERLCKEDPKSAEIIKPILRGRDIKRYYYEWAGLWLIATFPALKIDIKEYPAIENYLFEFGKDRLEQAGKVLPDGSKSRKKTGNKWFETQDQIAYYPEFEKEKIVYSEIVQAPQFYLDTQEKFYCEATALLLSGLHCKCLVGIFNSLFFS